MTRKKLALVFSVMFALSIPFSLYAQSGATGAIGGSVADVKGTPVANAQVEIVVGSGAVVRTVFSDAGGNFTAASLPVGVYDVVVKAQGMSTSKYSDVAVRLTETTRLNPSLVALQSQSSTRMLAAGDADKIMVVTEPPVVAVETSSPATGRTVEADVIGSLPLATQNFTNS